MQQVYDMPTVRKFIKAGELPRDWSREFSDPDQVVSITISNVDPALDNASSLSQVMDVVGGRARERGLTPEILDDLLHGN